MLIGLVITEGSLLVLLPALVRRVLRIVLNRPLVETIAELYVWLRSTSAMDFLYQSLRAASGEVVVRPMGSRRPTHDFHDLAFNGAQLARRPVAADVPVHLEPVPGADPARPLTFSMPVYVSGMASRLALNANAGLALAEAGGRSEVPLNSGQGPLLEAERAEAYRSGSSGAGCATAIHHFAAGGHD